VRPFEQDILRLDVAMQNAAAVGVLQRVGDVARDLDRRSERNPLLAAQPVAQRFAFDERHGEKQQPCRLPSGEDGHDVGVPELRRHLDLALKALDAHPRGQLGRQHLDHHRAPEGDLLGLEDAAHSAAADFADNVICAVERRLENCG